jgi:hypothetical protein
MFYFNNFKSKFFSRWCNIILASVLIMQFWGYQHRIAHTFSSNASHYSVTQLNNSNVFFKTSDSYPSNDKGHQCIAWDHAALGFGFSSLIFQIELLFLSFNVKHQSYLSHCYLNTFYFQSRAPPNSN